MPSAGVELEDELDDNLNEISDMTKRLKALGTAMGQELDTQNARIGNIAEKADRLDGRLYLNTQKVSTHFPRLVSFSLTTPRSSTESSSFSTCFHPTLSLEAFPTWALDFAFRYL